MKKFLRKVMFFYIKLKIKFNNRKSRCWSCDYFIDYDEKTFKCNKHRTSVWGDEELCRDWKVK